MVDPKVVDAVRKLLAGPSRRILVTGGTGFIGSRVAWLLAEAGQHVTALGRNRYRVGRAWHPQVRFVAGDLGDVPLLQNLCRQHDAVIHAAAHAATWGDARTFQEINVDGTRNVIAACQSNPSMRLVHVSSTAIHFEFRDKLDVTEDSPLPTEFSCEYAASKAAAETVVRQACDEGVNAVTLRARAVFGSGDNSLLPRLLNAAQNGHLPQIGDGKNRIDLTYVDNVAYAICLALCRGESGSVCTITNEDPIPLWPTLNRIFESLGLPKTRRRIPYRAALVMASALSGWHALRRKKGEPKLTRYGVGLLATSQTFSPEAARKVLEYRPLVSVEEGIRHTLKHLTARDESHSPVAAEVTLFTTGYTPQPYFMAERGQSKRRIPFHAMCALIRHPVHGLFLFDTGYSPRFLEATARFPFSIYGHLSPVVVSDALTLRAQLAERGVTAADIRGVIVSHFHADHVAGTRDFPQAEFIASQRAWQAVEGRQGFAAVSRAFLPTLLPDDFAARLRTIDHFHDPGMGPFARSHDLFGDGSIRLIELSGHATGQIGALIQTGPQERMFLVADATWTLGSLRARTLPHPLTYSFIDSVAELRESLDRLHAFSRQFPDVDIVPTHCPEIAKRFAFDEIAARLSGERTS